MIVALALVILAIGAAPSSAAFSVSSFSVAPSTPAAAAHPDVVVNTAFGDTSQDVRNLRIHLPPGLVGNPKAVPACSQANFAADTCPANTIVGSVTVNATALAITLDADGDVYNVTPSTGEPARLGIWVRPLGGLLGKFGVPVKVALRTATDYGLDTTVNDLPNSLSGIPVHTNSMRLTLFGTPPGASAPFMTNPTSCAAATSTVEAAPYSAPSSFVSNTSTFTPTACGAVPFAPTAAIALETSKADEPSGYTVTIGLPAAETPLRQAHVRRTEVVLPEGTTLNPGSADGLQACSDDQFGIGKDAAPACPAGSQVGTVSFDTPLVGTLGGKVFFGTPAGATGLRLLVSVEDPASGIRIKLTGDATVDPGNGRISTVFDNLPQVPFTSFKLSFNGGAKAILANPAGCGTYPVAVRLTPWSGGADANPAATFTTDDDGAGGACPPKRPFSPSLSARADSTQAGGPTGAFTLRVQRPDRDQRLRSMAISMPPGLAGQIAGLPTCPDDKASSGDCPDNTRVGTVGNTVGTGDAPITLTGPVYLGNSYKGGLLSLIAVVPAKVGPLDLGRVVLRNALFLRPNDGGVDVRSDDLPSFLSGIPVAVRSLSITLDKPGFLNNPTSCAAQSIGAKFTAAGGDTANSSAPFQATGCDKLPFAPKITGVIGGRGQTRLGAKTSVTTTLTQAAGEAATKSATVVLPPLFSPDSAALSQACPAEVAAADQCPASSVLGTATAVTPLLPIPLSGPVLLVRQPGQLLPGLEVHLGPLVALKLPGTFGLTPDQRISSTFDGLPDVPISKFELSLTGGLAVSKDLCTAGTPTVDGSFLDQNGRPATDSSAVTVVGCDRPVAALSLRGVRRGKPRLTLSVRAADGAPDLRSVELVLAKGLTGNARSARKGIKGKAARKLSPKAVKVGKNAVKAKLPAGTRTFKLTLSGGAVRASRSLRRKAGRKTLAFDIAVDDASGEKTPLSVRAKARR